ncbi:Ornithine cyclodeaminase [Spironucleus salmonicida]|uniref:Ornithine cyclodeaminase n=1 Tax=Spironucleus salmonicida TaxID=348837 RepID=V6LJ87_9EUKA|nr:Ornithine cyclodeaminase [Spironucleus salmonicida]|eukprot:EST43751.1 Ornithine cyclodeaminase [Spironucleus salmonicida]
MRVLSKQDILTYYTFAHAINATESAFVQYSTQPNTCPVRANLQTPSGNNLFMPASTQTSCGCKIVTVRAGNLKKNLPTINAIHADIDEETGVISTILDGAQLTIFRTGAASGVATRYLAKKDASSLLVVGAGIQGMAGAQSVFLERKITKICVFDTRKECFQKFQEIFQGVEIIQLTDINAVNEVIGQYDIVITTTTSETPVVDLTKLKEGCFVSCVGAYQPHTREVDITQRQVKIVVDTRSGCFAEAGEVIIPAKEGKLVLDEKIPEIGEIAAGKIKGRENDTEIIIFKTVGCSLQDCVVGREIAIMGAQKGLGVVVEM